MTLFIGPRCTIDGVIETLSHSYHRVRVGMVTCEGAVIKPGDVFRSIGVDDFRIAAQDPMRPGLPGSLGTYRIEFVR